MKKDTETINMMHIFALEKSEEKAGNF